VIESTTHTAPLEAARLRRNNLVGAAYVMAAAIGFTVVSILVKKLGNSEIGVFQTVAVRTVIGLTLLAPLFVRAGIVPWRTQHLKIHLTRAVLGGTAVLTGYYAFMKLPLAEVTAISFTVPLFVTVAAVLFLGEIVRWRRWTATGVGFVGVLVVARPFEGAVELATMLAVAMALCIAFSVVLLKRFPAKESQLTMLFFFLVVSGLMAVVPAITEWQNPSMEEWLLLAGVGVMGLISQAIIIRAFRVGEASFVAPFDYVRLLFAGTAGVVFFAETPDVWTYAGAVLIIGSTLYIARREAMKTRQTD
jgi:drug/metabolite transporter (DMT)-like permease